MVSQIPREFGKKEEVMITSLAKQFAVGLVAALLLSQHAAAQVIYTQDFETAFVPWHAPSNTTTFPGFGQWYCPNSPADLAEADGNNGSAQNAPIHSSFGVSGRALRTSYAFDAVESRVAVDPNLDTWDSDYDYTLAFKIGSQHARAQDIDAGCRVTVWGDNTTGGTVDPSNEILAAFASSEVGTFINVEVIIRGRDILQAGADGQTIYLGFYGAADTDIAWVDDIVLSKALAAPVADTGNYRVLLTEAAEPAVNEFQVVNGNWSFVRTIVDNDPNELVPGVLFESPVGLAFDPVNEYIYIGQSGVTKSYIYEVDMDGVPTTNGPLGDGIIAESGFEFDGKLEALYVDGTDLYFTVSEVGGTLNGVWKLDLNTYAAPVELIPDSGSGYNLNGVTDLTIAGDGNLYVCNRGALDPNLVAGEDQILRFNPANGALIDVFYDLDNRPSGIDWDAANSRLLVAFDDVALAFTDLNNSSVNTVVLEGTFPNDQSDLSSFGSDVYVIDGATAERVLRSGLGQNAIYGISGQLDTPKYMVNMGSFEIGVWDGGGANDFWNTALNWLSDAVPDFALGARAAITFTGTTRLSPANDIANAVIDNLSFDPNAGSFSLSGNAFTLEGTIDNLSTVAQTIGNAINSVEAVFWTNDATGDASADLTLTGNIDIGLAGELTTFGHDGDHQVTGAIVGDGDLIKLGPGSLELAGANTFTGAFEHRGGQTRLSSSTALGDPAMGTILGIGENVRMELAGGITVAEPITYLSRFNPEHVYRGLQSITGANEITGDMLFEHTTSPGAENFIFAALTGSSLKISGALSFDLDPALYLIRTTTSGGGGTVEWATPIFGSATVETRIACNGGVTILSAADNDLSGRLGAFGTDGEIRLINATTTNNVPDVPQISAESVNSVVDFSGLSGGGIEMSINNLLLDGKGTFRGNVKPAATTTIIPTDDATTLTFEGGLDLSNGPTLEVNIGTNGDLIRVSGGTLIGSSTGATTLRVIPAVPFTSGTYTLIDFSGASASGVDPSDFVIDTSLALGLVASANVIVTATEVQLSVTANPSPINDVLVVSGPNNRIDHYKVQAGNWAYQGVLLQGDVNGEAFEPFSVVQDTAGDLYVCEREAPYRLLKFDRSGFFLGELARGGGVDYAAGGEYLDIDPNTGDLYMTLTSTPRDIAKYDAGSGSVVPQFITEDGAGYTTTRMRGLAVAPNGRLFACDTDENQVLEFDLATGAFTQVIDTPLNAHPCYWDKTGNRLITNGSFPVQVQEYAGGLAPANPLLDQVTGLGAHDFAVIGGNIYIAGFGNDTIYVVDSPTTSSGAAYGTPGPVSLYVAEVGVSTAGRYDLDLDDDVDFDDVLIFMDCLNGPGNSTVPPGCTATQFAKCDADGDNDVDVTDLDAFMQEYSVVGQ
jgi:autotransporter-associated beta strand protein